MRSVFNIDELLEHIREDKSDNLTTTSKRFKRDVWEFFNADEFKDKHCVEFGTHKGQTTYILSHLFKLVSTINISIDSLSAAKTLNTAVKNIDYIPFDLYKYDVHIMPTKRKVDVFFIDAGHNSNQVYLDISRALHMNISDDVYFVFDDYGMMESVRSVVDLFIDSGHFEVVKYIGHEIGHNFGGTPNRILQDWEGIIVKLNNSAIYETEN